MPEVPDNSPIEPSIAVRPNGSLRVTGVKVLIGTNGERLEVQESFSLCRCGGSKTKPFCDGTHKTNGFTDPAASN